MDIGLFVLYLRFGVVVMLPFIGIAIDIYWHFREKNYEGETMKDKIKDLLELPEWNQEKLAIALNVSINTVKSWTRTNDEQRRNPNKWVMPELEKIFDKAGVE